MAAATTTTTSQAASSGALAVSSKQQLPQQHGHHHHVASKSMVRAAGGLWVRQESLGEKKKAESFFAAFHLLNISPTPQNPFSSFLPFTFFTTQSRALSAPVSLALTAAAAATSVAARALAAAGCPPDGYVTSLKVGWFFSLFSFFFFFSSFLSRALSLLSRLPLSSNDTANEKKTSSIHI